MKELDPTTVESSELVEQTFNFWLKGREHIRSPFPEYIWPELKEKSTQRFYNWTKSLNDEASKEIDDEIIGEKFEEIIFETAIDLVQLEDERITINYPFLPRIGDKIKGEGADKEDSTIYDRQIIKDKDALFLKLKLEKKSSKEKWETKFELPA